MSRCEIENKVVVITGAGGGIGAETARHLAARGAKVLLADLRAEPLEALAAELRAAGTQVRTQIADVTRRAQVEAMIERAVAEFGRIDVIVNNAGLMALAPVAKLRVDEWERMVDINFKGVLYGVAAALPRFQAQGGGHIVNLASVAGIKVFPMMGAVYSATKFAVRAFTEGLRSELTDGKVRVTLISPGAVATGLKEGVADPDSKKIVDAMFSMGALSPDAVARAIVYALEQPADVDVNEIVLRPSMMEF